MKCLIFYKVLFQYKDSRWPVVLGSGDNIVQKVRDYYSLNSDHFGTIIFQKYSEMWSEWVDIQAADICDNDRVNIIVLENPTKKSLNGQESEKVYNFV